MARANARIKTLQVKTLQGVGGSVAADPITTAALTAATVAATGALTYPDAIARTATSAGATTGTIANGGGKLQFVTVTSNDANHIIILPAPVVGTIIILRNGATGYELRSSAPATVAINGGVGTNAESAIAANTMVIAVCTSATTWQAIGLAGTTLAAVEAAAP